jgi:GNAT superfamily N-acetyltransferase
MEIYIRQIEIEDAEAIARLSGQFGYPSTTEETKDRIIWLSNYPDNCGYVAFYDTKMVAWIHVFLAVHVESEPFFEIGGLVVDENYRGNGIGKQLVDKVILWCKNKGKYRLRVRCNVKRIRAHEFYKKLGFHDTKESKIFEKYLTK